MVVAQARSQVAVAVVQFSVQRVVVVEPTLVPLAQQQAQRQAEQAVAGQLTSDVGWALREILGLAGTCWRGTLLLMAAPVAWALPRASACDPSWSPSWSLALLASVLPAVLWVALAA